MKQLRLWFLDWRIYIAEFLGTFTFIFLTLCAISSDITSGGLGKIGIALTVGFSYSALLFATVHLSGGYLNPAITISLWLTQKISSLKAFTFVICQIIAGIAATLLIIYFFGFNSLGSLINNVEFANQSKAQMAAVFEAIATAILIFTVFASSIDRRGPISFGPIALGLMLGALTFVGQGISGAFFNPALVIGPNLILQNFERLALYVISPLAGSVFALIYEFVFLGKPHKSRN